MENRYDTQTIDARTVRKGEKEGSLLESFLNFISKIFFVGQSFDDIGKCRLMDFNKVNQKNMPEIWDILSSEKGRTTDFSYGGLLMWVDMFKYDYSIVEGTLFIRGVVENDVHVPAFSLPVGAMPLKKSVGMIIDYCCRNGIQPVFSAIPEYAVEDFRRLRPKKVEELTDWADYLYDAEELATLKGKKYGKKRNHVNKFLSLYPDWSYEPMTSGNAAEALAFMDLFDKEGDRTPMAVAERTLSRKMIRAKMNVDENIIGALLKVGGEVCAYTIGDIKGDTLFIHVEKATRAVEGSYEMINKLFAEHVCNAHPEVKYINREDDAGDEGLRKAKESYHPVAKLVKYNIIF